MTHTISRSALITHHRLTVAEMQHLADLIRQFPDLLPETEDGMLPFKPAEAAVRLIRS